jgi:hypothetical protein
MAAPLPRSLRRVVLAATVAALGAEPARAQLLPWEVVVAEIEAGRLRNLAQRLSRQHLVYQLHLADAIRSDLVATAGEIDRVLGDLERGSAAHSVPAAWTPALREQLARVDAAWGPLRQIALASPYDRFRVSREFAPAESRRGDPLLLRYFDDLSLTLVAESEELLAHYHDECTKTGLEVCPTARTSGYAAMLIERATKEAVYVVAGIDVRQNRARLDDSIAAYREVRRENDQSPFFSAALDPERGPSARAARDLLVSLRGDWDAMEAELRMLDAGDEPNFDLRRLLDTQARLVDKVERLTAALVRYASLTYGT